MSQRLSLTALGRGLVARPSHKHRIKRVDRFPGNAGMHGQRHAVARQLAHRLSGSTPRPVIVVDWTQVVDDAGKPPRQDRMWKEYARPICEEQLGFLGHK